jgi:hypothetical protein
MDSIDIRFNNLTVSNLRSLIGTEFSYYLYDSFFEKNAVYKIVGLFFENQIFKLTNHFEVYNRFGSNEEVGVLMFDQSNLNDIKNIVENNELSKNSVNCKIVGIQIVNETQTLCNKKDKYNIFLTRGLVFQFENGTELSFEKQTWFSELITIREGTNLLEQFTPINSFLEEWEDCPDTAATISRNIIELK